MLDGGKQRKGDIASSHNKASGSGAGSATAGLFANAAAPVQYTRPKKHILRYTPSGAISFNRE